MSLSRLDLNLFRVLDAVYAHGGISAAARHLHLSQSAVSHALARLRQQWGDELFVRQGNAMVPTELTRRVIGEVQAHLRGLAHCWAQADHFDPLTLEMTLRVGMRDVLEAMTLPPLMAHLSQVAPKVRLTSVRVPREALSRSLSLGEVDLVIDRQRRVEADIRGECVAHESLAVVLRRDHPLLSSGLNVGAYFQSKHLLVTQRADQVDPLQSVWQAMGLGERQIALRCQHYFSAANVAAHSDALLTLPRLFAEQLCQSLPLAMRELPVPLPTLAIWMYWHVDRDADPVHRWMREGVMAEATRAMHSAKS
jgi:DNA-binding transcriptional LysR family regulator